MNAISEEMPCPRCKKMHARGDYGPRPELATKPLREVSEAWSRKYGKEVRNGTPFAPPDVQCECGALLHYTVPLFAIGPYGWHWRIL
jgi:hypothetical protein